MLYLMNKKIPAIIPPSWWVYYGAMRSDPIEIRRTAKMIKLTLLSHFPKNVLLPSEKYLIKLNKNLGTDRGPP